MGALSRDCADLAAGAPLPSMGVAVKAVLLDGDGRILLIQRPGRDGESGLWDLPGGKLDHGETLWDALVREVREETGLAATAGEPVHIGHFAFGPVWVTSVTFACRAEGTEVALSEEHEDFAWISVAEIPDRQYFVAIREQLEAYARSLAAPGARKGAAP